MYFQFRFCTYVVVISSLHLWFVLMLQTNPLWITIFTWCLNIILQNSLLKLWAGVFTILRSDYSVYFMRIVKHLPRLSVAKWNAISMWKPLFLIFNYLNKCHGSTKKLFVIHHTEKCFSVKPDSSDAFIRSIWSRLSGYKRFGYILPFLIAARCQEDTLMTSGNGNENNFESLLPLYLPPLMNIVGRTSSPPALYFCLPSTAAPVSLEYSLKLL